MACKGLITLAKPNEARSYAALLFDMDGLLFDTERAFLSALQVIAAPLGIPAQKTETFFLSIVGTSGAETGRAIRAFLPETVDPEAFEKSWRVTCRATLDQGIPMRPFTDTVLPKLRAAGHKMALVSSSRRAAVLHHLEMTDMMNLFDVIVSGDDVSAHKPDPMPYLRAAELLGVDPADCAAFEDSDLGIAAAVAAGCIATQIPDLRPIGRPLPDIGQHIAPDLRSAMENLGLLDKTPA